MSYREGPIVQRSATRSVDIDQGLRSHMMRVFNFVALALVVTGLTSFLLAQSPTAVQAIYGTPLKWVVMLAPLGIALFFSLRLHAMSYSTAQLLYWAFSIMMGLSLGSIFLIYTGESIARVFFITAGTFGLTSLYGYTTQRDLTNFGSFLMMGLIGIVLASVVNLFMKSNAMAFAISVIAVLVFVGLTAYDTQAIRRSYYELSDGESLNKAALFGALQLYLDFINLFVHLLRLLGDRR